MEYGDKFKKAVFGGFDREDVLRCFEEMSTRNAEELEAVRKELAREKAAKQELEGKYADASQQLSQCREQLDAVAKENEEWKARQEAMQKEMQSLKALNSELSVKRGILEENNRSMKKRIEELEEKENSEKASFEIGEMMVEAKKTADHIISRANEKADSIRATASGEAKKAAEKLSGVREQLSRVGADFRKYSADVLQGLKDLDRQLEHSRAELLGEKEAAAPEQPAQKEESAGKNPYEFLFRK